MTVCSVPPDTIPRFCYPTSNVTDDHLFIGNNPEDAITHPSTWTPEGWAAVGLVSPAFFIRRKQLENNWCQFIFLYIN